MNALLTEQDDHDTPACLIGDLLSRLNSWWVRATYPFALSGRKLKIHYASEISRRCATRIWLGDHVTVGKHVWLVLGMEEEEPPKIVIEEGCSIGPRCTISSKNSIHLEPKVVLASNVLIMDHGHAYEDVGRPIRFQGTSPGGKIHIGQGCQIGDRAAVLCAKGEVVLGRNCLIAPGAVVSRSFPANSVIAGNPGRLVTQTGISTAGMLWTGVAVSGGKTA